MGDLEPGTARITHPDSGVEDAVVPASAVPHWQNAGWRLVEGDAETWPAELQRFEGATQVFIRHPITGGTAFVTEGQVPHLRERGWEVVDPDAEQAADLEDKKVAELRDLAKERGISPIPTTKADLLRALQETDDTDQAGEPAPSEEDEG